MGRLKKYLACSTSFDCPSIGRAVRRLRSVIRSVPSYCVPSSMTSYNCADKYSRVDVREPNSFQSAEEYCEVVGDGNQVVEEENRSNCLDGECDPTKLLNNWLSELDTLKMNLQKRGENYGKTKNDNSKSRNCKSAGQKKQKRCSIIKLDSIQDDEILSILGDLTVLETQLEQEIQSEREKHEHSMNAKKTKSESLLLSTIDEEEERIKADNIKVAIQKIKEASVKKLFIKVFTSDGSSKSLLVDENMTVAQVTQILVEKNLVTLSPLWALVELVPELHIERVYEDHELLVENCLLWKADSKNTLWFMERPEKFDIFRRTEEYILMDSTHDRNWQMEDYNKQELFEEYFSGLGTTVLEVEGHIWLKLANKKNWNKYYCVLRPSGLYYSPKKRKSFELLCLATFDVNQVYYGVGWKGKYKAPTEFCFGIKHPQIQAKNSQNMKCFCVETEMDLHRWVAGIRLAKNGQAVCDNYRDIIEDMAHKDIDELMKKRCSVNSNDCLKIFTSSYEEDTIALTPTSENRSYDRYDSAISSGQGSDVSVRSSHGKKQGKCVTDIPLYASSSSGCLSGQSSLSDVTFAHDDDDGLPLPPPPAVDSITSLGVMEHLPPPPHSDIFYQADPLFHTSEDQDHSFQQFYSCICSQEAGNKSLPPRPFKKPSLILTPHSGRRITFDETVHVIDDEAHSSEKLTFDKEHLNNWENHVDIHYSVRDTLEEGIAKTWSFKNMTGPVNDCETYEVFGRRENTFKTFFEDVWFDEAANTDK